MSYRTFDGPFLKQNNHWMPDKITDLYWFRYQLAKLARFTLQTSLDSQLTKEKGQLGMTIRNQHVNGVNLFDFAQRIVYDHLEGNKFSMKVRKSSRNKLVYREFYPLLDHVTGFHLVLCSIDTFYRFGNVCHVCNHQRPLLSR